MEERDDALVRSVVGQARMIEHYTELQENYNELVEKHRGVMEVVADVKRAASKAASGRRGARFAKALSAELSAMRVERERDRELLRKENRSLKVQLKDTAEAVHAAGAGEVLVRLRETEEAALLAEDKNSGIEEENEKLRRQMEKLKRKHKMEKLKRKHKMEMITMKQYLAESRLPEAALRSSPLYQDDSDMVQQIGSSFPDDDDQAWKAEFGAIYQVHY